ncbi:MAG: type II secretion system F family protein [Chloroflexi bacterium]|nr:type II secretion system F family protein [Chloroflexota bacterium]
MLAGAAAFITFAAVFCVCMAFAGRSRQNPVEARVRRLASAFDDDVVIDRGQPFVERIVMPLLESMGSIVAKMLPTAYVARIRHLLTLAGQPFSLAGFLMVMAVSAFAFPTFFLAFVAMAGASFSPTILMVLLALIGLGFYLPYFWLARRVGKRQNEILKSLPNAFDLVSTCVEAGLGLDAAFAKVTEKLAGPFGDELRQALREMAMGQSRRDALLDVGERTGVSEVVTFVNAIIHAEVTGSSIADVLRVQSDQIRIKRRQRVEQTAQRIPIWMTFPLVLFLLPSLFIVLLGPAGIQVYDSLVTK